MWFYNANNHSVEREERTDSRREHPVREITREVMHDAVQFGKEEMREEVREHIPPFVHEGVKQTGEWFEHMMEHAHRNNDAPVSAPVEMPRANMVSVPNDLPPMVTPAPSIGRASSPRVNPATSGMEGSLTELYPAIPDPTVETSASKTSAEVVSKQIDGQGYWVTDIPIATETATERDDLAAINTGYAEPETVG